MTVTPGAAARTPARCSVSPPVCYPQWSRGSLTAMALRRPDRTITVAAVVITGFDDPRRLGDRVVPVYREPERAIRAPARAHDHAQNRPGRSSA